MSQDNKIRLEMAYLQGKQSMICQVKYFDMWKWCFIFAAGQSIGRGLGGVAQMEG